MENAEVGMWITTGEAAELSGYSLYHIRRLLRSGWLRGQRFGAVWQVDRESLAEYMREASAAGAKRGPKKLVES